ncbi:MAG: diguanylate cyclase [Chloroflexota bacterium]|nr:MAG: hypothetical protein DLM70_09670 [Chloroflexota bacterium]
MAVNDRRRTDTGVLLEQASRIQTLNEISRVVSSTLNLRTLYDTIYEQVGRVMDTTQFFIALHRPERNAIDIAYQQEGGVVYVDQEVEFGTGMTTVVIEHGMSVLFRTEDEFDEFLQTHGLPAPLVGDRDSASGIFVPLNTGNRTIGAMTVQSERQCAYTEDDVQTLAVIASQAAVAIENARLYQRSQESVAQMEALLRAAQSILGTLDLRNVLDSILTGMREVMPYYFAAVLLPDHSKGHLDIAGTVGPLDPTQRETMRIPFGEGVTGTVFCSGEVLLCDDVRECEEYIDHGIREVLCEVAVPLKRGDTVVGVLDVERDSVGAFSQADLDLLTLCASQAAIAIENARLFTEQQRRVFELQSIQSIVQKLTPLHDVPAIAAVINCELKQLIDYHSCRLFLLDRQHDVLVPILLEGSTQPELRVKLGMGVAGWIAQFGRSVIVTDSLNDPRGTQIPGTPVRAESIMGAPLIYEGRVQGVITLSKLGVHQFDQNALRLLEIIAAQTAIALDRSRLYDELRPEAVTDELTKLYNRRYLLERFKEERSRALRNGHSLVAMMLDIDRFKTVNDTYGHDAGDVVLRELALIVRAVVRAEDIVARYGGEEFCVLLPEISADNAERVADRLRLMIARHAMPASAGVDGISVSIGLATLQSDDGGMELFSRADLAMYKVKHAGGDRVCVVSEDAFRFTEGGRDLVLSDEQHLA